MAKVAPYGSWASPFTAAGVSASGRSLSEPKIVGDCIYWLDRRPQERGRVALMRWQPDTQVVEVTQPDANIGTSVHEYGGGSYAVSDQCIYVSSHADHQLYRIEDGVPHQITDLKHCRFADFVIDPDTNWIYSVLEDHRGQGEAQNKLVRIEPGDHPKATSYNVIASGKDFYASLRLHHRQLTWLVWNHPNMPWDSTELWQGQLDDAGRLVASKQLAGDAQVSLFQPEYSPSGELFVVSDQSNWWNLYRVEAKAAALHPLFPHEAEFGQPQWQFGMRTYAVIGDDDLIATCRTAQGIELWRIKNGHSQKLSHHFAAISHIQADAYQAVFIGAFYDRSPALMRLQLSDHSFHEIATTATEASSLKPYVSSPEPLTFAVSSALPKRQVHAFYYPPKNPDFCAPKEQPPLLVMSHGGPTAAATIGYNPKIQFWTSRGFAVVDVDYSGSTGYGRTYRNRLKGYWGILDREDCAAAADYLVARGDVDPQRLCIRGSSAGGFTTLSALTFLDTFKVGASYYGIGDLEALAKDTHKFESRYLDGLVGPYPAAKEIYLARSPIRHSDQLSCPVIFFQGMEDAVVPPAQAEAMVAALKKRGIPTAILRFEGEGHGFVQGHHVTQALLSELAFYGEALGFKPADPLPNDDT